MVIAFKSCTVILSREDSPTLTILSFISIELRENRELFITGMSTCMMHYFDDPMRNMVCITCNLQLEAVSTQLDVTDLCTIFF